MSGRGGVPMGVSVGCVAAEVEFILPFREKCVSLQLYFYFEKRGGSG